MEAAREAARAVAAMGPNPPGDGTLTDERLAAICDMMRCGIPFVHASWLQGVNPVTLRSRMTWDSAATAMVETARSQGALMYLTEFCRLAEKDKKSARLLLDLMGRLYPGVYGETKRIETSGEVTHVHTVAEVPLTAEQALKRLEVLRNELALEAGKTRTLPAEISSRDSEVGDTRGDSRQPQVIDGEIIDVSGG